MKIKDRISNKMVFAFLIVSIVCAAIFFVSVETRPKLNLSSYIVISVDGLNTQGTASYKIDKVALEKTLIENNIDLFQADMFIDTLKCNLDKNENLKNGDKLTATINFDSTLAKQIDVFIGSTTKEVIVSGLADGTEINIFKDVDVLYTGISPMGKVSIINKSSDPFISSIKYSASKENVANGDKITISSIYDTKEAIKSKFIIRNGTKEYIVSGLPEYLSNSNQLNSNIIEQLNRNICNLADNYLKQTMPFYINHIPNRATTTDYTLGDNYSYKNIRPLKAYIVTNKPNANILFQTFKYNVYCCIFSVDLIANGDFVGTTYLKASVNDIVLEKEKISGTNQYICQYNTMDDATREIESDYSNYNLEPIQIIP